jgi:hypothetical protein
VKARERAELARIETEQAKVAAGAFGLDRLREDMRLALRKTVLSPDDVTRLWDDIDDIEPALCSGRRAWQEVRERSEL